MSKKIAASVIFSILISFGVLFFVQYNFPEERIAKEQEFYSQTISDGEIIFLMGSSHVGQLNSTLINEKISQKFPNFDVYNLSYNGDTPSERIQSIDKIKKFNPKIIFYGISFRDFQLNQIDKNPLPDPQQSFKDFIKNEITYKKINPKFTTLEIIRDSFADTGLFPTRQLIYLENSPFFSFTTEQIIISSEIQLQQQRDLQKIQNPIEISLKENGQIKDFNLMIEEFQKSGIEVVIFTTPLHNYSLDQISPKTMKNFSHILENVQQKFKVKVYDFSDKYVNEKVWANINHISFNKEANVYSEDISEKIIFELED